MKPITPKHSPRFNITTQQVELLEYLSTYGYAIVASVASPDQIETAKDDFWRYTKTVSPSITRDDVNTWDIDWKPSPLNGIMGGMGFNHSDFLWNTRLLSGVKDAFATVWETDDLLVSFDAGNAFRPWKKNPYWLTEGGWWHVDQNSLNRPHRQGKVCVQGLVSYYDANEETGGLCVVPGSHLFHDEVCGRSHDALFCGDFVPLDMEVEPVLLENEHILVCCQAGDMILWDSRTIHCNTPALTAEPYYSTPEQDRAPAENDLIRLVGYTCMLPRSHASEEIVELRKEAFINRYGTTHWPNQKIIFDKPSENPIDISQCPPEMLSLVGYR